VAAVPVPVPVLPVTAWPEVHQPQVQGQADLRASPILPVAVAEVYPVAHQAQPARLPAAARIPTATRA
jgi:hypothetical protein